MIALAWLLIIAVASLLIVRLGTTALTLTGLARETAEFQAYSAFFGVGFTTRESEQVVNHPVRRRIMKHLILAGQVGLTSVIVPLVVTFVNVKSVREGVEQLGLIVVSLALLWLATNTRLFKSLVADIKLTEQGIVVLGITRNDGVYVGVPRSEAVCRPLDVLLVYGREPDLQPLLKPTLQTT